MGDYTDWPTCPICEKKCSVLHHEPTRGYAVCIFCLCRDRLDDLKQAVALAERQFARYVMPEGADDGDDLSF